VTWHREGLGSSKAVDRATAEYRTETDVLERFFVDECVIEKGLTVSKRDLWEAWERWCSAEGVDEGTQVGFSRVVKERGIILGFREGTRSNKGATWSGIGLRSEVVTPQKSCKDIGITSDSDNFDEKKETFSENPLVEGPLGKTEKVVTVDTDEIIPPSEIEVDGVETEYGTLESA